MNENFELPTANCSKQIRRSTSNTSIITGFGHATCLYRSTPLRTLRTRTLSHVWTCAKSVRKQSIAHHLEHEHYHGFGHVKSLYRSSPLRSTLNTNNITTFDHVSSMCRSSPLRNTLHTKVSELWTRVKYMYPSSPLRNTLNTNIITGLDMWKARTEAVHCVPLWVESSRTCLPEGSPFRAQGNNKTQTNFNSHSFGVENSIKESKCVHEQYHNFGHVSSMCRSSPWRSTLNTNVITALDTCQVHVPKPSLS